MRNVSFTFGEEKNPMIFVYSGAKYQLNNLLRKYNVYLWVMLTTIMLIVDHSLLHIQRPTGYRVMYERVERMSCQINSEEPDMK